MGWKNVKEQYRIGHSVQVTDEGNCIGSPYIHDLIVIGADGRILKRLERTVNADLNRYQAEMDADPAKLKELAISPDSFDRSLAVYTYVGGNIIEKVCETIGWPNPTHDGKMMYSNTFSADRAEVVRWAIANATAKIESLTQIIDEGEKTLAHQRARQEQARRDLAKLISEQPVAVSEEPR